MSITFSVSNETPERVRAEMLAVAMYADREPGPGADVLDAALNGGLRAFLEETNFTGKAGETLAIPTAGQFTAKAAVIVGLGPRAEVTTAVLRQAGAAVARRASKARSVATTIAQAATGDISSDAAAAAVAEGVALGSYKFLEYKSDSDATRLDRIVLLGVSGAKVTTALQQTRAITEAVAWARDMVNQPSDFKSPADFATAARKFLGNRGVKVTVLAEPQLRAQKMGGVLGVGQGSERPPRFVKVVYEPTGSRARGTLALVGKGITFDSGGLSIKTASGMETMKTDMSGAAAVLATMSTLRALGIKHRVIAYAPMAENMPSGNAIRPGDVLRIRNGKTVEVLNTDAEGRLVLADALSLAASDGVDAMIDLATLTGACVVALGEKVAGLMGNHSDWGEQVRAAADRAGERVWPLPLPDDYRKMLDSEVADLRNVGTGGMGGALTAGLFLEAFVDDVPWVHLDIAGPARAPSDEHELTKGGTGFGVRTLVELARTFDPPKPLPKKKVAKKKATKKTTKKRASAKKTRQPASRGANKGRRTPRS